VIDLEAVRSAYANGESRTSIAARLGISYNEVWRIIRAGTFTPTADGHISDQLPRNSSTYTNYRCRCDDCSAAGRLNSRERSCDYRTRMPAEVRARAKARKLKRDQRLRDETAAAATKHGQPWTFEEIDVACDPTLSAREAALRIGRSIDTVKKMRRRRA
jgi:hypothetical protein